MTGTLNAAKGLTAAAGADSAPRPYVFYLSCLIAYSTTCIKWSPYTGIALLIIAIPSVEVKNSGNFDWPAKEVAFADDVKRWKSCGL